MFKNSHVTNFDATHNSGTYNNEIFNTSRGTAPEIEEVKRSSLAPSVGTAGHHSVKMRLPAKMLLNKFTEIAATGSVGAKMMSP